MRLVTVIGAEPPVAMKASNNSLAEAVENAGEVTVAPLEVEFCEMVTSVASPLLGGAVSSSNGKEAELLPKLALIFAVVGELTVVVVRVKLEIVAPD